MVTNINEIDDKVFFDVDKVADFQDEITMEIVDTGMDNEDTVNEFDGNFSDIELITRKLNIYKNR